MDRKQSKLISQSRGLEKKDSIPELLITSPSGISHSICLEKSPVCFGMAASNHLSFPEDDGLSRSHLVFEKDDAQWFVKNLSRKNGTFVNGILIRERHKLKPGDRITASWVKMKFSEPISGERKVRFELPTEKTLDLKANTTTLKNVLSPGSSDQQILPVVRETHVNTLWAFVRAGQELAVRRPLPELFRITLDLSLEAVGAERGVLLTLDEGDRLVIQASHGVDLRISTSVRDRVLKEKTSLLVHDMHYDRHFKDSKTIVDQGVHSLIAVPLQTENRVTGLMYLDSKDQKQKFTKEDLNLITAMAFVLGIQIERERWEIHRQRLIAENVASLGRLAAALSHEFNTPLGTLKCTVDTLVRAATKKESASPDEKHRLEEVQADLRTSLDMSITRMQEVIQRIKRFANLDQSEIQVVDIHELISDVITIADVTAVEMKLASKSIPKVICHRQSMITVFSSLLNFLLETHQQESEDQKIVISLSARGETVEVCIKDNGRGISPENVGSLFDPSFQIVEGRISAGNWRLFTARQMIQEQGGEIRVSSKLGKGTTLVVILPSLSLDS